MTDVVQLDFDRIEVFNAAIGRWKLGFGNPLGITIADTGSADAFNRLRVSNPQTVFEVQNQYNAETLRMEAGNTGTGVAPAHDANSRMVTLRVNAGGGGGISFLQSFQYLPYQPGKSQLILMTGVFGAPVAGAIMRFGYGDANNGIFYEQNSTAGVQFTLLSAVSGAGVQNSVSQLNWNIDKFNGTGPSQLTLDPTKSFILVIDLQFLAMGRVRCGFEIGGSLFYAHEFNCANVLASPYMQSASLPVKAEVFAPAAIASIATASFKCAAVCSEGGVDLDVGRDFSTEGVVTAASGTRTHILSLRPAVAFNGIANRGLFVPESVQILAGSNPVKWELVIGAAFTVAPAFAAVNATYSFAEAGTGGSFNNLTNGVVVLGGYVSAGSPAGRDVHSHDLAISYPITLDRAGAQRALGTLSVLVTGIGGTSDCRVSLNWREVR